MRSVDAKLKSRKSAQGAGLASADGAATAAELAPDLAAVRLGRPDIGGSKSAVTTPHVPSASGAALQKFPRLACCLFKPLTCSASLRGPLHLTDTRVSGHVHLRMMFILLWIGKLAACNIAHLRHAQSWKHNDRQADDLKQSCSTSCVGCRVRQAVLSIRGAPARAPLGRQLRSRDAQAGPLVSCFLLTAFSIVQRYMLQAPLSAG